MLLFQSPLHTGPALGAQSRTWERNPLCFAAGGSEAAELGGKVSPQGTATCKAEFNRDCKTP